MWWEGRQGAIAVDQSKLMHAIQSAAVFLLFASLLSPFFLSLSLSIICLLCLPYGCCSSWAAVDSFSLLLLLPWFDLATLDLPFSIYSLAVVVEKERERENDEERRQQINATSWIWWRCSAATFTLFTSFRFLSALLDKHVCVPVRLSVLLVPHQNTLIRFACEQRNVHGNRG